MFGSLDTFEDCLRTGLMGNHPSAIPSLNRHSNNISLINNEEMDDTNDSGDSFEGFISDLNELFNYQEHLLNVLNVFQCMVTREILAPGNSNKMPIIKKKPNLSEFRKTQLYDEIKVLSGYSELDNITLPKDNWSLTKLIQERENGLNSRPSGSLTQNECRRIRNIYIPNRKKERMMSLESKVFCGTFNKDGSRLLTASQDNIIRVFDSSKGTYHRINRISARDVSWCILDVDFSPDGSQFVYSTWSDYLHIAPIHGQSEEFQWLHLNPEHTLSRSCIFSVRFSPCGKFLIGGANDGCIYLYDRAINRRTKKIRSNTCHYTDINAVSFVDDSPNIFVSGCDEGIIKLWDLRVAGENGTKNVAVFVGHYDGITYIDSRGDGRHILSNSKDQSIKIWDLRVSMPGKEEPNPRNERKYSWDYRWDDVPKGFYNISKPKKGDTSVMTYRGHRVTKSLIRAKFSPAEQTGQRYIYTGCGTGRVIIFDVLTGVIKEAIEGHRNIVRDVAWHPVRNEIVSSSWDTHVNLNTYKRNVILKRHLKTNSNDEPLRRSRRIALRNSTD